MQNTLITLQPAHGYQSSQDPLHSTQLQSNPRSNLPDHLTAIELYKILVYTQLSQAHRVIN